MKKLRMDPINTAQMQWYSMELGMKHVTGNIDAILKISCIN
jgi:hypothetical protein